MISTNIKETVDPQKFSFSDKGNFQPAHLKMLPPYSLFASVFTFMEKHTNFLILHINVTQNNKKNLNVHLTWASLILGSFKSTLTWPSHHAQLRLHTCLSRWRTSTATLTEPIKSWLLNLISVTTSKQSDIFHFVSQDITASLNLFYLFPIFWKFNKLNSPW